MQARLAETERIVAELQSGIAPATHTPVHIRDEAAVDTLRITARIGEAELAAWLGSAFERLSGVLDAAGVAPVGYPGTLYDAEIADELENAEAFIPVAAPFVVPSADRGVSLGEVPAARVAVLVHAGDYESMADTYRSLGAWVSRHAHNAGERLREWYVVGPGDVDDPALYRTEISWPITDDSQ
jgi:effector-binding domain-containing protein